MVHECACAYACACVFGLNNLHLDFFPCDIRTAASLDLASDLKQVGLDHFTCATTPTALFTCEATRVTALEWRSGTTLIKLYTPLDNVGAESTLTALGTMFTTNITHNVRVDPLDVHVVNITSTVAFPIVPSLDGLVMECTDQGVSSSGTLRLTPLGECSSQADMCMCTSGPHGLKGTVTLCACARNTVRHALGLPFVSTCE